MERRRVDGLANFVPRVAWEMYGMANAFTVPGETTLLQ